MSCPFCDRPFWGPVAVITSVVHEPGYEHHKTRYAHLDCWAYFGGDLPTGPIWFHLGMTPDSHENEGHREPTEKRWQMRIPIWERLPSLGISAEEAAFEGNATPQPNHVRDAVNANR